MSGGWGGGVSVVVCRGEVGPWASARLAPTDDYFEFGWEDKRDVQCAAILSSLCFSLLLYSLKGLEVHGETEYHKNC